MVAVNRGADFESFDDINQGKQRSIKVAAAVYVSIRTRTVLGAITKNIKKSQGGCLLLVIGTADPFYPESKAMFDSAPPHALNRYGVGHRSFQYAESAAAELLQWLDLFAQ